MKKFALLLALVIGVIPSPFDSLRSLRAGSARDLGGDDTASEKPGHRTGSYVGVASCAGSSCHGSTRPLGESRVLQNEFYTWLNSDRHAQAYNVLFNDESELIGRNMKLRGAPYEARLCLDCHTLNRSRVSQSGRVDIEDGISCESCHGPAGGWLAQHTEKGWTHADSVRRGMIDLRDISTRGRLCLSCHLGDATKAVDHELIAAGHPRLTFELDNYTEAMPPHWTLDDDTHGLRAWAVGQAVSFHQSLEQVRRSARSEKWPEFSVMVCTDCHHSLKDGESRQYRGYTIRAGVPHWSPVAYAVFRHLLSDKEQSALSASIPALAEQIAKMRSADAVAGAAGSAASVVRRVTTRLERSAWTDTEVRRVMLAIARDRVALSADVQVAEQAVLALQSLSSHLATRDRSFVRSSAAMTIDELFAALESADDFEPRRFETLLAKLERNLGPSDPAEAGGVGIKVP